MKKQRNRPTGNLANDSSVKRLAEYRATAARYSIDWRRVRYRRPCSALALQSFRVSDDGREWYADRFEDIPGAVVVWRQSEKGIDGRHGRGTTGYYCDDHQGETVSGVVVRISTARGRLYLAGVEWSDRDGITVFPCLRWHITKQESRDYSKTWADSTDLHGAAIEHVTSWADECAEQQGDEDCEFYARDIAEQDITEAKNEMRETRAALRAILAELRALPAPLSPAICDALRGAVRGKLASLEKLRRTIAARRADLWSAINR